MFSLKAYFLMLPMSVASRYEKSRARKRGKYERKIEKAKGEEE